VTTLQIDGSDRADGESVRLFFEDEGSGPPLVLVHCWPLSGEVWNDVRSPLVNGGHRVVTYDRRGFGRSTQPAGGYDYDTLTADLWALLDHLDLDDVTLVGYSMGAGEVVRLLGRGGNERIGGAVLVSGAPPCLFALPDNPEGPVDDDMIAERHRAVLADPTEFADGFSTAFLSTPEAGLLVDEATREWVRGIAADGSLAAVTGCAAAFSRTDFRPDLARIQIPTLVVHGGSDVMLPFEVTSKRTHDLVANSELRVIEGAPHGIAVTHPTELAATILDFLARTHDR
jgi:non-heme chloroperoxidase